MGHFARKIILFIFILLGAGVGILGGQLLAKELVFRTALAKADHGKHERYRNLELFQKVLHYVESNYVEEVDNQKLIYGAIKGMLETLDPHSNFLPPEVYRDMKIDTSGKFGGLGIEIGLKDGVLTVISPIEDTPAWRAGLKPGDRIVKINGSSTKGLTLVEAVSKMRGKRGTAVRVGFYRKGFKKVREVSLKRADIKIPAVKSELIEPQYGYVRLSTFNQNAGKDIESAIRRLEKKKKLKGLVLDLRNNPGGLLDQAVSVSSLFLDDGVVVSTIGRDKSKKEVKHVHRGKARKDFQLAVLVNSASASAAEIVAGALQDHRRAVVMGESTFGKGSVQTVTELGEKLGLKLTVARYYTPSGRSIQEKGIRPDIPLEEFDARLLKKARKTKSSVREKDLKGHMKNEESKKSEDDDFRPEELEALTEEKKSEDEAGEDEDLLKPLKFDPKDDYQVREAVNYLKSYDIFRRLERKPITPELPAQKKSSST